MKKTIKWTIGLILIGLTFAFLVFYTSDTDADLMIEKYSSETSQFLELASGDRIHYRDTGNPNGKVFILVHGSNSTLHTWEGMVGQLKSDYRLISIDLPGNGLSGPSASRDYRALALTKAVLAVMDKVGVQKGIWVGNSMGGWLTWRSALSHPDRVTGLVLISPSGAPRDKPAHIYLGGRLLQTKVGQWLTPVITPRAIMQSSIEANFYDKSLVTPELVDRYWELFRYPGNRVAAVDRAKVDREPEYWNDVSDISVPLLVLWGEADSVTPFELARKFKQQITDTEIITYPKVGHLAMEEIPETVSRDIAEWTERKFH